MGHYSLALTIRELKDVAYYYYRNNKEKFVEIIKALEIDEEDKFNFKCSDYRGHEVKGINEKDLELQHTVLQADPYL